MRTSIFIVTLSLKESLCGIHEEKVRTFPLAPARSVVTVDVGTQGAGALDLFKEERLKDFHAGERVFTPPSTASQLSRKVSRCEPPLNRTLRRSCKS